MPDGLALGQSRRAGGHPRRSARWRGRSRHPVAAGQPVATAGQSTAAPLRCPALDPRGPAADPDLYCIELIHAPDFPGASGYVRLTPSSSPFGVAVTVDGHHRFDLTLHAGGLPDAAALGDYSGYVAWATTPRLRPVVNLGPVAERPHHDRACRPRQVPGSGHRGVGPRCAGVGGPHRAAGHLRRHADGARGPPGADRHGRRRAAAARPPRGLDAPADARVGGDDAGCRTPHAGRRPLPAVRGGAAARRASARDRPARRRWHARPGGRARQPHHQRPDGHDVRLQRTVSGPSHPGSTGSHDHGQRHHPARSADRRPLARHPARQPLRRRPGPHSGPDPAGRDLPVPHPLPGRGALTGITRITARTSSRTWGCTAPCRWRRPTRTISVPPTASRC